MKLAVESRIFKAELAAFYCCTVSIPIDFPLVNKRTSFWLFSSEVKRVLSPLDISSKGVFCSLVNLLHYFPTACLIWDVVRLG